MKNNGATAAIAVTMTILNLLRYNLPERIRLIEVFDMLNLYCWLMAVALLYLYEQRPAVKSLYFFGIAGISNALLNETFFTPTLPSWSENLMMIGAVNISWAHYIYLTWKKKKPIYRNRLILLKRSNGRL